ncbi:MAG: DUF4291 family protein [Acetatifactor sp.]|nr:DUF4291 family protein [Acetatifactor sp.]
MTLKGKVKNKIIVFVRNRRRKNINAISNSGNRHLGGILRLLLCKDGKSKEKGHKDRSDIRCQWDPERDLSGNPMEYRSIQLGLRGRAVYSYNICYLA